MEIIQTQQQLLFVITVKQHGERDRKLQEYYNKIRSIYPVDTFEIEAEDGRKLNFYREHFLLNLIEDDADIKVDSQTIIFMKKNGEIVIAKQHIFL